LCSITKLLLYFALLLALLACALATLLVWFPQTLLQGINPLLHRQELRIESLQVSSLSHRTLHITQLEIQQLGSQLTSTWQM